MRNGGHPLHVARLLELTHWLGSATACSGGFPSACQPQPNACPMLTGADVCPGMMEDSKRQYSERVFVLPAVYLNSIPAPHNMPHDQQQE